MEHIAKIFSARLSILKKGESVRQMAKLIGISQQSLDNYIKCKRSPNIEVLAKIASTFGVTTDYLIGLEATSSTLPMTERVKEIVKENDALKRERDMLYKRIEELESVHEATASFVAEPPAEYEATKPKSKKPPLDHPPAARMKEAAT